MNCEQFARRMHQCLDLRLSLGEDADLNQHAERCASCRRQREAWRQIAAVLPERLSEPRRGASRAPVGVAWSAAAGLAAVIGLAAFLISGDDTANTMLAESSVAADRHAEAERPASVLAQASGEMDPAGWWRSVQDRDWVSQTMPAVRSVREGVAPLGRSLMRAVTILTIGGRDRTS